LAAIIVLVLAWWLYQRHHEASISKNPPPVITKDHGQSSGTKTQTTSPLPGQGGAVDQQGQATAPPPASSTPVSSASGQNTLEQPSSGAKLSSGDTISGTAHVSNIQFRLTDDVTGVISQGSLNVVNGKYAGLLKFHTTGTAGRLDVFSLDPTTGAEANEVQVQVSF